MVVWKPVYGWKCLVFELSAKSHEFTIWIPDAHTVQYSGEFGIQVFSIQMVTVLSFQMKNDEKTVYKKQNV